MKFDSIIVGGGIAGLTCGIRCAAAGLKCAIISSGMSALHFASGSIDLLGRSPAGEIVYDPFSQLPAFIDQYPQHPYAKCGETVIAESLDFLTRELEKQSLQLCHNGQNNHFHLTPFGTLTPTYLSQQSVYSPDLDKAVTEGRKMALLDFEGFRDFHVPLVKANLPQHTLFKNREIITGTIPLTPLIESLKNPHEFRSIDISRMFETEKHLLQIAKSIDQLAGDGEIVGLPACVGFIKHNEVYSRLQKLTGRLIYEIPTLPPSILGMRLDHNLKSRFSELGGVFIAGDKVIGGKLRSGRLSEIYTQNHESTPLQADAFVLASGSFFSGGLVSEFSGMQEPVFDLALSYEKDRKDWAADQFFEAEGHPYLEFGVKTNEQLNPFDSAGQPIDNLYCAGALLAGYNPIREGSGGGVAISSGYYAAENINKANAPNGAATP
jgi:glycerol-3-phosphate dehydrogenase subunit B